MQLYILILLLIVIAIFGNIFHKHRRWRQEKNIRTAFRVLTRVRTLPDANVIPYLRKIDPFVFEELLLTVFEEKGYKVIRNKRYTGDGGIDGRIIENGNIVLIQAKRYKSYVSREHIMNFRKLIEHSNSNKGYFIHTGKTGSDTLKNSSDEKLIIISGHKLIKLICSV